MELPSNSPVVIPKSNYTARGNSFRPDDTRRPWAFPITFDVGSEPSVKGSSITCTVPNGDSRLLLPVLLFAPATMTELGLLPLKEWWRKKWRLVFFCVWRRGISVVLWNWQCTRPIAENRVKAQRQSNIDFMFFMFLSLKNPRPSSP